MTLYVQKSGQVEMNMEMPFIPAGLKPSYRETCTSLDQERNLEDMQTLDCGFEPSGLLL